MGRRTSKLKNLGINLNDLISFLCLTRKNYAIWKINGSKYKIRGLN